MFLSLENGKHNWDPEVGGGWDSTEGTQKLEGQGDKEL